MVADMMAPKHLTYLGNLLWAIGSVAQAERAIYGGEESVEYLAIGRRVSEMEWEALRLIERGTIQC